MAAGKKFKSLKLLCGPIFEEIRTTINSEKIRHIVFV
jgi:hypothetical protein